MGLDVSHGAWNGGYGAFNLFRTILIEAVGGKWATFDDPNYYFGEEDPGPGLKHLFAMNDCEGEIPPEICAMLADELEAIAGRVAEIESTWSCRKDLRLAERTLQFARGAREAAESGECLEFF